MKLVVVLLFGLLTALGLAAVAQAEEVTIQDVEDKFADFTRAEIEDMGYVVDSVCVDAGELPPPVLDQLGIPSTAAMGFHAVNESLFDTTVDALEPEVILLGPGDVVWGVEYESAAETETAVVLGQELPLLAGGHPGMEFDHYAMHAWFVENPAGQFADFNSSLTCAMEPPPVSELPPTGGSPVAPDGNGLQWYGLLIAAGTLTMITGGLAAIRARRDM